MGVLIKGDTDHYDMIKDAATAALMDLQVAPNRLPPSLAALPRPHAPLALGLALRLCSAAAAAGVWG
jgi:hypothetical protein